MSWTSWKPLQLYSQSKSETQHVHICNVTNSVKKMAMLTVQHLQLCQPTLIYFPKKGRKQEKKILWNGKRAIHEKAHKQDM